jgi:site-specific DNA-methyltransferase (adenine-specific)
MFKGVKVCRNLVDNYIYPMLINGDAFEELANLKSNSINLILVDPPYFISRNSGFAKSNSDIKGKYGKISLDFGEWDQVGDFDINFLFLEFYRVLKKSGTLIMFYDIWKSSDIKNAAMLSKFKQPRVGVWLKSNPVPINSCVNYLSNAAEYFFTFVKSSKPTFNSSYDNAVYNYPLCHGKERLAHPTQKPLQLILELVEKHSNPGDLVLDAFAGTGTTAHACILSNRDYIMIEKDTNYYNIMQTRLQKIQN